MRPILAAACLVVPLLAHQAQAQTPGETIDVGGWKVHNQRGADGVQTCAAVWTYDDKSTLGFTANTEKLTFIVVSEPEATLTKGQRTQFKYRLDKGPTKTVSAFAVEPKMIVAPVANADVDFKAFRRGSTLFVEFGGDKYEETLDGVNDAIVALGKCVAEATDRK